MEFFTMVLGSNNNEYQEHFMGVKGGRCVGLTTSLHSCADSLNLQQPKGQPRHHNGIFFFFRLGLQHMPQTHRSLYVYCATLLLSYCFSRSHFRNPKHP